MMDGTRYVMRLSFGFLQHRILRFFFAHGLLLRFNALNKLIQFAAQPVQLVMELLKERFIIQ